MHHLTSKYKLYLYLFFFIFLTSILNFKFLENFRNKFTLKKINLEGISGYEKEIVQFELNKLKNKNILRLSRNEVFDELNNFRFLEDIYVKKIIPSSLNINLSKTSILGKTVINGENFYIGKNGKFINSNQLVTKTIIPSIFGEFKINDFLALYKVLVNHELEIFNIEEYYYYKNKRWDLLFSNGLKLKLPSENIDEAIKFYKKLLENDNLINTKIVDLRVTNQIILTN